MNLFRVTFLFTAVAISCVADAKAEEIDLELTPTWEYVSDRVMGGLSDGGLATNTSDGGVVATLSGRLSLENNGGFIQMAFDLNANGAAFDALAFSGLELDVSGNGESYEVRLRTTQLAKPWQSFRAEFIATQEPRSVRVAFSAFKPHRTEAEFDPSQLRRIGVLAIGRVFDAYVTVTGLRLYK